ncbi:MAG: prepilin-type N-terminal cleavage/methylation domain-containing protein [Eubacteriaceae bacterium]|nr:prepilin-type N-terminal cleavage/methylation domain-containing protein [Eubacteriaceae bacterium]
MMMGKNQKKGFTLTEVIVVLVILAILAAIFIPTMIHYINKSEKQACALQRSDITRYYSLYKTAYSEESFEKYVQDNYGDPDTLCPSDGKYTFKVVNGVMTVICSKHSMSGETAMTALGELLMQDPLRSYFAGKKSGSSVDSEAPNAAGMKGIAAEINELLKKMGIDTANSSWRIYKDGENDSAKYTVYWTDSNISGMSSGDSIKVTRYTVDSKGNVVSKTESGSCKVKSKTTAGNTYNIIDGGSFK